MSAQHTLGATWDADIAACLGVSEDTSPLEQCRGIERLSTLRYIADAGQQGRRVSYCMPNARTLLARGLIEKRVMRHSSWYFVTDAGRAAIAKATGSAAS